MTAMNMRKKEILIVEDNSEVRDFLFLCLEDDYSVFQAEDGIGI